MKYYHHVEPIIKTVTVFEGVTYMEAAIAAGVSLLVGFGIGWYIKGRGMAGVKIDISNIKNDVESLKAKVMPVATPAPASSVVLTPVVSATVA